MGKFKRRQIHSLKSKTMALDKDKMSKALDKALADITPEEIEKYFPADKRPKGWISIEDSLPQCLGGDFITQGYSRYKVKNAQGEEFFTHVCDHNMWYVISKEEGVTHWWNPYHLIENEFFKAKVDIAMTVNGYIGRSIEGKAVYVKDNEGNEVLTLQETGENNFFIETDLTDLEMLTGDDKLFYENLFNVSIIIKNNFKI